MSLKISFKIVLITFLTLLLTSIITKGNLSLNSLIGFVGIFYLTVYFINNSKEKNNDLTIILSLLLSIVVSSLEAIISYFFWSFPNPPLFLPFLILHFLAIISGYCYLRLKHFQNVAPFALSSVLAVFMFFQGWNYWLHKINYGTFTGKIEVHNLPSGFEAFDKNANIITDKHFGKKIVLLDFWNTSCGVCFQKFPILEKFYKTNKNNSSLIVLAVNIPIEEDVPNQAFTTIVEKGYSFPVVVAKNPNLAEKFGVKGYPTTFLLNQNQQLIYRGNLEGAIKMFLEQDSSSWQFDAKSRPLINF